MSFIHVVGRVAAELELKVSHKGTLYVRFALEEQLGNGRIQSYQVWAYGWDAEHLAKWKVGAGTMLEVNGTLLAEEYTAKDGYTPRVRLKVIYKDGGPLSWANPGTAMRKTPTTPAADPNIGAPLPGEPPIDGEREPLPD
ncbi:hypothetical protein [Intestinimonas sp. HCP28S3_D6]|uniref:hypothetical protein n=1 Tax=Intestinimonas sp. HCP28S3_D6 TaxID=3438942 RepID=UPI003F8BED2A